MDSETKNPTYSAHFIYVCNGSELTDQEQRYMCIGQK